MHTYSPFNDWHDGEPNCPLKDELQPVDPKRDWIMNMSYNAIQSALDAVDVYGEQSHADTVEALIVLANLIIEYDGESEKLWYLESDQGDSLDDLCFAAYWHLSQWHAGQYSREYLALCRFGEFVGVGISDGPEPDSAVSYICQALDEKANKHS